MKIKKLVDKTIFPSPEPVYVLPPLDECADETYPVSLPASGHRLIVRIILWGDRERMVDYAIMQQWFNGSAWVEIARIDCKGGQIHRHQFDPAGVDVYDHRLIRVIPQDGIVVVEEGYGEALDTMQNEWHDNYRRFSGDGRG